MPSSRAGRPRSRTEQSRCRVLRSFSITQKGSALAKTTTARRDFSVAITTTSRPRPQECATARGLATATGCPYVPRGQDALAQTAGRAGCAGLLVVERTDLSLWVAGRRFRYHPNMAKLRVLALRQRKRDALIAAMKIAPGESVLDCTCGLGADAIVASWVVRPAGRVRALEASPLLALLVERGMASCALDDPPDLVPAMRRVEVCCADFARYLRDEADNTWDVVYFDPMFTETIAGSEGLNLVRCLAEEGGPSPADLDQARRVARRRVVMKDRRPGHALTHLGFAKVEEGRRVCYGALPAW